MKVIALEEHFMTPAVFQAWERVDPEWRDLAMNAVTDEAVRDRLTGFGERRLADMRAAGVDVQVLSFLAPGLQNLADNEAAPLQVEVNDRLADVVRSDPQHFQGLATLATSSPDEAARELDRCVRSLGFNGGMIYGRTRDRNADHRDFWPIYEAAEALRAPLYLHPQSPPPQVRSAYYDGFPPQVSAALATFTVGWHFDAGIQFLRMVTAGVFDRFPDLQVILGHWGEMMLFYIDRLEMVVRVAGLPLSISDYFRRNVFVTPGGILSQRYLRWAVDTIGVERILFAVDYPFELPTGNGAADFIDGSGLGAPDRESIASGNWERLVATIRR